MSELDDNTNKSELYENNDYYNYMSTEDNQNFKELNAEIDFDQGTVSTVGVDDHDLPYLLKTDKSELIQEFKTKVDNKEKIEPSFLTKMGGIVEGFKSWTMSAPSGDYKIALDKASLQIGDAITQFNRLITGGKIDNIFDDQPRIFRLSQEGSADIVIRATNSEVEEKFYNMQMEFRENGKYHPFEADGNLKEGWQEISQFVAASDDIEYTNKGFTPAPFVEYGLAYGVPGVGLYKALANANSFRKIPLFFQVLLAETGVEFAMASQKKDDVNLGNVFKAFGFGDIDENVPSSIGGKTSLMTKYINVFRESVAADLDDTVFERKWKNASGNAPIGVGLGAILQMFRMAKKFKYNKSGRKEIATNIDQEIIVDKGLDGEYKVYDTNGVETGGFKSQAEAEEFAETLGEGFEAKSLGAAATPTTKEDLSNMKYVDSAGNEVQIKDGKPVSQIDNLIPSEKPFYSNVENAISNMTMKSGNGDQILATLNNTSGIKQSEIEDLGLNEFLAGKKKVTKEELDDFIADKSLTTRVKDTFLEGDLVNRNEKDITLDNNFEMQQNSIEGLLDEAVDFEELVEGFKIKFEDDKFAKNLILKQQKKEGMQNKDLDDNFIIKYMENNFGITKRDIPARPARYKSETLPGGEDYKEILITAPGTPQVYTKHHFNKDVPPGENLIAHARFNTRTINDKKTLFIEEIQSDLHQAGRKKGYTSVEKKKIQDEIKLREKQLKEIHGDNYSEEIYYDDRQINTLIQKRDNVFMLPNLVADAPFKKNWHELTMKRLIKYAVDNDFEAISFTPGSVQNKRYELSRVISKIQVAPSYESSSKIGLYTYDKDNLLQTYHINPEQLKDYVGKDLSEKILKDKENSDLFKNFDFDEFNQKNVSEQDLLDRAPTYRKADLEIGGEGMKGFYDNILPTFLKKFGKKYNAKLEKTNMSKPRDYKDFYYGYNDIDINKKYDAIGRDGTIFATYKIYGLEDDVIVQQIKDGTTTILFEGAYRSAARALARELEGFPVPQILKNYNKTHTVPFMVITPEMKKDILTKGVPIAKVEDREEKTSAIA